MVVRPRYYSISEAEYATSWETPVRNFLPREMSIWEIDEHFSALAMQYEQACGESIGLFMDMERELRLMRPEAAKRFVINAGEYLRNHPIRVGTPPSQVAAGYGGYLADRRMCPAGSPAHFRLSLADHLVEAGGMISREEVESALFDRTIPFIAPIAEAVETGRLADDERAYSMIIPLLLHSDRRYRTFALRLMSEVDKNEGSKTFLNFPLHVRLFLILFEQVRRVNVPLQIKGVWWDAMSRVVKVSNTQKLNAVRVHYLEKVFGEMLIFLDVVENGKKEFKKTKFMGRRRGPKIPPVESRMKEALSRVLATIENPLYAEYMDFASEFFGDDVESAIELFNSLLSKERRKKRGSPPKGSSAPPAPAAPETSTGGTSGGVPPSAAHASTVTGLFETGETSAARGYVADISCSAEHNVQRGGARVFRPQMRSRIQVQNLGVRTFIGAGAARTPASAMP